MNPSGEKTEQATPRRLIKARKEGQFAASHDFVSGLQFTVFVILIAQTGPSLLATLKEVTRGLFIEAFRGDLGPAALIGILHEALSRGLSPLVYASGILLVYRSARFSLASTGFSFSLSRMAPKPSNFDVFSKLQSLPQKGLVSAIQAIALVAVFGATIYWIVTKSGERLLMIPLSSFQVGLETLRSLCMDLLWKAAALFLLFGFVDFFRQKRKFSKQMRMSKQDIRDEVKEVGRKSADQNAHPALATRRSPPPHDGRSENRHRGGGQPNALCRRDPLPPRHDGRAAGGGEREELFGAAHSRAGPGVRRAAHRESALGTGIVQICRSWTAYSAPSVSRRSRDPRLHLSLDGRKSSFMKLRRTQP